MQLIVHFNRTHVAEFETAPSAQLVKDWLNQQEGIPADLIELKIDGHVITGDQCFSDLFNSSLGIVRAQLKGGLCGGKGGFGAQLRALARQKATRKTTDFGACRDLSGRRLRHVNDEILLQKWKEAKDRGESFDADAQTATGISLWYLSAPSWSEGITIDKRKVFMKPRLKTKMCLDWLRAREHREAPEGAPAHWGCPRGRRCEFAHGEEELRGEAHTQIVEAKARERRDEQARKRDSYMDVLHRASRREEEVEDLVLAGLRAKRRRIDTAAQNQNQNQSRSKSQDDHDGGTKVQGEAAETRAGEQKAIEEEGGEEEDVVAASWHYLSVASGNVVLAAAPPSSSSDDLGQNKGRSSGGGGGGSSSGGRSSSGGGSSDAAVKGVTGCPVVTGTSGFATVLASACSASSGCWYYEVELLSDGLMQLGWADSYFCPKSGPIPTPSSSSSSEPAAADGVDGADGSDGVGDDTHSWAFDGYRQQRWHKGQGSAYGPQTGSIWKAGDVIGCFLRLPTAEAATDSRTGDQGGNSSGGSVAFSVNGIYHGEAFPLSAEQIRQACQTGAERGVGFGAGTRGGGFFPALSLENNESVLINLGKAPFKYDPVQTIQTVVKEAASAADDAAVEEVRGKGKGKKKSAVKKKPTKKEQAAAVVVAGAAQQDRYIPVIEALIERETAYQQSPPAPRAAPIDEDQHDAVPSAHATPPLLAACAAPPQPQQQSANQCRQQQQQHSGQVQQGQQGRGGLQGDCAQDFSPVDLESSRFGPAGEGGGERSSQGGSQQEALEALEELGLAHLKWELERRGLKAGGTLRERAQRLLSVRGLRPEQIDQKLLRKKAV